MDCKEWLKKYLEENGPAQCRIVKDAAEQEGYTKRELKNARAILEIVSIPDVLWGLPE